MCFCSGYYSNGVNAIIVFAACFLPDSNREDYHEIMENLFLWVSHFSDEHTLNVIWFSRLFNTGSLLNFPQFVQFWYLRNASVWFCSNAINLLLSHNSVMIIQSTTLVTTDIVAKTVKLIVLVYVDRGTEGSWRRFTSHLCEANNKVALLGCTAFS